MKVLFVQNIEGIAGSEKYFWQLLPALKKAGVDVSFLCVYKKEFSEISQTFCDYLIQQEIAVHRIETASYLNLRLLFRMKKLIRTNQFDIIHSHLIYADFWSVILRIFFGVKAITVSTLHGYQENIYTEFCLKANEVPKNKYYRVAKYAYKRIDHVYACSEGLKNFFEAAKIKFKKDVQVIHHGFDYPELTIPSTKNETDFICAIPGRLIPRKGHQLLLKHCADLQKNISGFKLIIIGDGELREQLEKFVQENNLTTCVQFTGNVKDVRPHLAAADLILVPSYAEGLPLVIFEAMSVGKAVIAFDTIGPAEVVQNNTTGFLIAPFDENLFCDKIIELSKDASKRNSMGAEAKKLVQEKFSLKRMTVETKNFYQTFLK